MTRLQVRRVSLASLLVGILLTGEPARPDSLKTTGTEIVVGIVAVSAAIGVGIGFGVYHATHSSMKGCVTSGPGGIEFTNEGNKKTYLLTGTTTGVTPGTIARLKGKKQSAKRGAPPTFRVDKVAKTYDSCGSSTAP